MNPDISVLKRDMIRVAQILGLSLILDIILIDQLSKWWITEMILRPETGQESVGLVQWVLNPPAPVGPSSVPILPFFDLTMVWNRGVSFGLFRDMGIWPLVILATLVSLIFLRWMMKTNSKAEAVALAMIIGGAMGNVIDRFRFGAVADFFDVSFGTYHWPAFNVADSAITIGVAILLIYGLFCRSEDKKTS